MDFNGSFGPIKCLMLDGTDILDKMASLRFVLGFSGSFGLVTVNFG